MATPPANWQRIATLPYDDWTALRWDIGFAMLQVFKAEDIEKMRAALKMLSDADKKVEVTWREITPAP